VSTQINLKLSDKILNAAKKEVEVKGYDNVQDFIRESLREKLFESDEISSGLLTYKASEQALAKNWLSKKEDKAWKHLQKEI
jgi:Arc/MetJ-type ribon-helix-helix transcriptional regulator